MRHETTNQMDTPAVPGARIRRSLAARLMVATLAVAALASASPASTNAASWGVGGPASLTFSECQLVGGQKYLYAARPTVYASNRTAGTGNDRQLVRYWTRLVGADSRPITAWTLGGAAYANDNVAAPLPVYSQFMGNLIGTRWGPMGINPAVRVQYSIAWYNAAGTAIGNQEALARGYRLWATGHIGNAPSC
jgi:hypothetical protein